MFSSGRSVSAGAAGLDGVEGVSGVSGVSFPPPLLSSSTGIRSTGSDGSIGVALVVTVTGKEAVLVVYSEIVCKQILKAFAESDFASIHFICITSDIGFIKP